MESPVRIYSALLLLILLLKLNNCHPNHYVNKKSPDDIPQEQITIDTNKSSSSETTLRPFIRNNTWLYQRKNISNLIIHPSTIQVATPSTTIRNNVSQTADTTVNYGNKITFRGSVKYFVTRPPFKPKTPHIKRNITKSDTTEKTDASKSMVTEKQRKFEPITHSYRSPFKRKNNTDTNVDSSEYDGTTNNTSTEKYENKSDKSSSQSSNDDSGLAKEYKSNDRSESGKSLAYDFNIDKYTSPEFHDINNVYSQSISPEIEHFVVPGNVSDYFVSVGSAPYTQNRNSFSAVLTTPKSDVFDRRYKEISDSIRQNLADSEYSNKDKHTTENFNEISSSGAVNFDDLIAKANNNNTKVIFKNTKELTLTNSENSKSKHKDFTNSNGTNVFYEMSMISTESYDEQSSTSQSIPRKYDNNRQDETTTFLPVASNEVIHQLTKKEPNITRRVDHFKTNETRKEFLATIRMRAYTTPKPRIRISLKNNRQNSSTTPGNNLSKDHLSTTKIPNLVKMLPFTRRRPIIKDNTHSTVASKIDPVYQGDYSPTRTSDYVNTETDNSIPTLRKRGSVKFYDTTLTALNSSINQPESESEEFTSKEDDSMPQFSLPPTATAWALIALKDTPSSKRLNNSVTAEAAITQHVNLKTEEDLQILDKVTDGKLAALSNTTQNKIYEKIPILTPTKDNDTIDEEFDYDDEQTELASASRVGYTTVIRPKENIHDKSDKKTQTPKYNQKENHTPFESITKLPGTVTTPIYEADTSDYSTPDFTSEEDNYSTEDNEYEMVKIFTGVENKTNTSKYSDIKTTTEKQEKITLSTLLIHPYLLEKTTTSPEPKSSFAQSTSNSLNNLTVPTDFTTYPSTSMNDLLESSTLEPNSTPRNIISTNTYNIKNLSSGISDSVTTVETSTQESSTENNFPSTTYVSNDITTFSFNDDTTHYSFDLTDDKISEFSTTENINSFNNILTTEKDLFSTEEIKTTTDDSVFMPTTDNNIAIQDIETGSTIYYSSPNGKEKFVTMSSTTEDHLGTTTIMMKQTTVKKYETTTPASNSEENFDLREGKKTSTDEEEKTILSTPNTFDLNDNSEFWNENSDPNNNMKQLDSNEIPSNTNITNSLTDQENQDSDISDLNLVDITTTTKVDIENPIESTTKYLFTPNSNIEIIKPELHEKSVDNVEGLPYGTTPIYVDIDGDIDGTIEGSGAIAAITISVIGVVALLLLVGLLIVARGRRRSGGYGQRCTPVSLDSYSLDNVSVSGSTRRKARRPSKRSYGNPAYDESDATSHPMQFAALANFALNQDSIVSEFNEIPTITARADEVPPGCESKNRYSNVIPLPETRVMLKPIPGDNTSDYINANYVRGPKCMKNYYIACQAPLASTVNDFWRMIWEQNSRVVLMLTELIENGSEKCYEYIPPSEVSDNKRTFGNFQIIVKKREVRDKYVISVLQIKSLITRLWREVTHMWYFWPPKGVPDECHSIIAFLIEARSYLKASQTAKDYDEDGHDSLVNQNGSMATETPNAPIEQDENSNGDNEVHIYNVQKSESIIKNGGTKNGTLTLNDGTESRKKGGPLVIHCSPGTGRTGALIACDIGIRDFEMSRTVDVPKTVYRIRRDRANAVQTKDQYIFIYKVLSEYATKLTGGILDSI